MKNRGIILILAGLMSFMITGLKYILHQYKTYELGVIALNAENQKVINWPILIGAVLIGIGIVMIVTGKEQKQA